VAVQLSRFARRGHDVLRRELTLSKCLGATTRNAG
jgi:hypothetical protein